MVLYKSDYYHYYYYNPWLTTSVGICPSPTKQFAICAIWQHMDLVLSTAGLTWTITGKKVYSAQWIERAVSH